MSFKVPEEYRDLNHSTPSFGNNGWFVIPGRTPRDSLMIIASDGLGWEHVSVSKRYEAPSWDEMSRVKKLFWDDPEDCVIQYHPPASTYVNQHPYCLHLWRPMGSVVIPTPPSFLVGFK